MHTKNQATTQQLMYHYGLFSQIVRLNNTMSKISFLSFSAALTCNVWKRWNIIYLKNRYDDMHCCQWHIFTIKALLCISIFLYIWQWHVTKKTHRIHSCVSMATMVKQKRHNAM